MTVSRDSHGYLLPGVQGTSLILLRPAEAVYSLGKSTDESLIAGKMEVEKFFKDRCRIIDWGFKLVSIL